MNTAIAPSAFNLKFRLGYGAVRNAVARSARIVTTVSQFSRNQLDEWGVRKAERVEIAPCGCDHATRWDSGASRFRREDFPRPYVFALGSGAHKNFALLIDIAGDLERHGIDIVIAGGRHENMPGELVNAHSNVRTLGFVAEADLAFLFGHASVFAFPSHTEGFGIPPLEAMHFGCPVVASDAGSVPEILGHEAAVLLPPDDHPAWARALVQSVEKKKDLPQVRHGHDLVRRYTWEKTAKIYLDLIDRL